MAIAVLKLVEKAPNAKQPQLKFHGGHGEENRADISVAAPAPLSVAHKDSLYSGRNSYKPLPLRKLLEALYEHEREAVDTLANKHARSYRLPELLPSNPSRPADWRWQGAIRWLKSGMFELPAQVAKSYKLALRLLIAVAPDWLEPPPFVGVPVWLPGIYQYAMNPGSGDFRVSLESLILAEVAPHEIAAELGVSLQFVSWYEHLWFDVRSRLQATSLVVHEFIGSAGVNEDLSKTIGRERRRLAFAGGPFVARELNLPVIALPKPKTTEEAQAFLKADVRRHIERQGNLLLRSLTVDNPSHVKLIVRLWERLQLAELRSNSRSEHASLNRLGNSSPLTPMETSFAIKHFKSSFMPHAVVAFATTPKASQA